MRVSERLRLGSLPSRDFPLSQGSLLAVSAPDEQEARAVRLQDLKTYIRFSDEEFGQGVVDADTLDGLDSLAFLLVDGSNPMLANLDFGTFKGVNVVDPTAAQDAATKNYVDLAHDDAMLFAWFMS